MGGKNYYCTICKAKFHEHNKLTEHKKIYHPFDFKCIQCSKTFTSKFGLKSHMENTHNVDGKKTQSFNCLFCKKFFLSYHQLSLHIKQHQTASDSKDSLFKSTRSAIEGSYLEFTANLLNLKIRSFNELRYNDVFRTGVINQIRNQVKIKTSHIDDIL